MSLRSSGRLKARVIQGARRGRWLFLISYFFIFNSYFFCLGQRGGRLSLRKDLRHELYNVRGFSGIC